MTDESPRSAEPQIPGLRAMAIVRWAILVIVAVVAVGTWWTYAIKPQPAAEGPARYYCPMHPQITSPVPGTCPICFMNLEPIPTERRSDSRRSDAAVPPPPEPGTSPEGLSEVMLTLERRQTIGIATAVATKRSVSREVRMPAVIETPQSAVYEARVRTPGFIERVASVETGTRVRAGQPLAWIFSPEVLRAQEELITALRWREGAVGDAGARIDPASTASDAARSRLALLGVHASDIEAIVRDRTARRTLAVRSPATGVVTARDASAGTYATPEMRLFEITDLSRPWATATVPADLGDAIAVGTRGRFVSRASDREYEVEASVVEPSVSTETRTGRVRFLAVDEGAAPLPGDIGEVVVAVAPSEHVLVPRDAVVDTGTVTYVFVEIEDGLFAPRVVDPGPLLGDERAVAAGLTAGERVVVRGAFLLDSESRLQAALAPQRADAGARAP